MLGPKILQIILATGYRRSNPFLVDFHNRYESINEIRPLTIHSSCVGSTITSLEEPETKVAPIITDGTHVRSLHWTGHYIDDPTLALTTGEQRR